MRRLRDTSASGFVIHIHSPQYPFREKIVRGAVSNGSEWEFIILRLNSNGRGGGYKVSPRIAIDLEPDYPNEAIPPGPDILAGILAHWVRHDLFLMWHTHRCAIDSSLLS